MLHLGAAAGLALVAPYPLPMTATLLRDQHFAPLFGERRGRLTAGRLGHLTDEEIIWSPYVDFRDPATARARRIQQATYGGQAGLEAAVTILNTRPGALGTSIALLADREYPYAELLLASVVAATTREQSEYLDDEVQWLLEALDLTTLMNTPYGKGQARTRGLTGKYLGMVVMSEARKALASGSLDALRLQALAAECADGAVAEGLAGQCYRRGLQLARNLLGRIPEHIPSKHEWKQIVKAAQAARTSGKDGRAVVLAGLQSLNI